MRRFPWWIALIGIAVCPHGARADWQPNGNIVSPHTFPQTGPRLARDGHGGAFVTLDYFFTGPLVQRLGSDGDPASGWSDHARPSLDGVTLHGVARPARPIPDGIGGCYLVWIQTGEFCSHGCGFYEPGRLHAQRLTAQGNPAPGWPLGGLVVSEHLAYPANEFVATGDEGHGVWIAWQGDEFYAQHIGPRAERLTGSETVVSRRAGWRSLAAITPDRRGGAYLFWGEGEAGGFPRGRILGQRLAREGQAFWGLDGIPVSSGTYDLGRGSPSVMTTRAGDAVVAWSGVQQRDENIYATRVSRRAESVWHGDRVVCGATAAQADVHLANGPGNDVLVAWRDARPEAGVFAQRLDERGRARWRRDGVPVCPGAGDRATLVMCADGMGGAFLAWADRQSEWSLFATRLDSRGTPAGSWPAQAAPVCRRTGAPSWYEQPVSLDLATTSPGAAMLCWQDFRIPPTVPGVGYAEASFVTRLGPGGPAVPPLPFAPLAAPAAGRPAAVPAPRAEFALRTLFPNPSHGDATVRFGLANDSPATLEVFDVAGRRISARAVGGAAGEHSVALAPGRRLAPGIYLVRLSQSGHVARTRLVVTK